MKIASRTWDLAFCLGAVAVAGVVLGSVRNSSGVSTNLSAAANVCAGNQPFCGTIVGVIEPCAGGTHPAGFQPTPAAGTVELFATKQLQSVMTNAASPFPAPVTGPGETAWALGYGSFIAPTVRITSQTVSANASYRFAVPAGTYLLSGHYADGGNAALSTSATVAPGQVTHSNLPDPCY